MGRRRQVLDDGPAKDASCRTCRWWGASDEEDEPPEVPRECVRESRATLAQHWCEKWEERKT